MGIRRFHAFANPWESTQQVAAMVALMTALLSTSCSTIGPQKLVTSHTAYNDAVQLTVTREVLVNLVRSRYLDPLQFLRVSAINAQFSVDVGASAGVAGIGQAGTAGDAGGSIGYSDSPTITYAPQSDAGFFKSMFTPFELEEAIGLGLSYRFAKVDPSLQALSLRLSFGSINGANDFLRGQVNDVYVRRVDAIVRLLQLGAVYRQVAEWDLDTISIPKDMLLAEDMVDAFQWGFNFIEEDDGQNVRLGRFRLVLALIMPSGNDAEVEKALADLGVQPGRTEYVFRPPSHLEPGSVDPYAIQVTPRSMLDVLNLAARTVAVPEKHIGIVPPLEPWPGHQTAEIRIRSSQNEPDFPYRVQHRDTWFYVDDSDLETRAFLEALVAAYASRLGSREAIDETPQVVLPVGG